MASPALTSPPPSSKRARSHSRPVSGSITATSSVGGGRPSEPGGVSGVTLMEVPPSLDPYPSTRRQAKRRSKMARSGPDASVPNPCRSGLSASSSCFGGGQDVGECLADVGEPGGAEVPDVGEKARRAEAARQRHRGAHRQRRSPQGHDGVAVEERHGAVTDVVAFESVGLGGPTGDGGQATLGAPHGLGVAGGARREQQQQEVVGRHGSPADDGPGTTGPGRGVEAGEVVGACRRAGCGRSGTSRSRPSRSAAPGSSVTRSWQSVKRMSRASSSPRRVGLIPTTVAPASAAAPSHRRYSGTLSSRTPMWNGPGRRSADARAAAPAALGHDLAPCSRWCRRNGVPGRSSCSRAARSSATVRAPARMVLGHGAERPRADSGLGPVRRATIAESVRDDGARRGVGSSGLVPPR